MDSTSLSAHPDAPRPIRLVLASVGTVLFYVMAGLQGLLLDVTYHNVTTMWQPSGVALAVLLIFGLRLWPAIAVGAFIVTIIDGMPLLPSIGIATGNTLAALAGALAVRTLVRKGNPLDSLRGIIAILVVGGLFASMICATVGIMMLPDAEVAGRQGDITTWLVWWLGDTTGVVLITPLILTWKQLPRLNWTTQRVLEAVFLFICTLIIAQLVFGRYSALANSHYPLSFLPLTSLAWAAMRFGKHGATACLVLVAASAVWGTIGGSGPFVHTDMAVSMLLLQIFIFIAAFSTLLLTASISERRRAQHLLEQHHEERANSLGEILEHSLNEIYMFDRETFRFISVNHGARKNLGYTMEELRKMTPLDIKPDYTHESFCNLVEPVLNGTRERLQFETVHQRKDGSLYPVEVSLQLSNTGGRQVFVAVILDISERYSTESQLEHVAHYDALTNLPNRVLFNDRLTHALQHQQRSKRQLALIYMDLDEFKKINDSLGHKAGDELLQQVAQRLLLCARKADTVARLGGDEFTIVLEDLEDAANVPEVADRILESLAMPFDVSGREIFLSASIGVSVYPQDGKDTAGLMQHADVAMFQAKKDGGNKYRFYHTDMTVAANKRLALETDLRHALAREEFVLHYQPQVSLESNLIVGLEALVRWHHPQHGIVPPNMFIPVAEESGLIQPLGEWVMRAACRQAKAWQESTGTAVPVAVNLSGHQINDGLVEKVSDILAETGLEPRYLELEITESCIMDQAATTIEHLHALRKLGVHLSIDDFGTGYSSMSYLKRLPINTLKIDRSFVRDIPQDSNDAAIIKAILALAHTLNLVVVAEGVETPEQRTFLTENHCDVMQGFLFSRPLPAEEIEQLLSEKPSLRLLK